MFHWHNKRCSYQTTTLGCMAWSPQAASNQVHVKMNQRCLLVPVSPCRCQEGSGEVWDGAGGRQNREWVGKDQSWQGRWVRQKQCPPNPNLLIHFYESTWTGQQYHWYRSKLTDGDSWGLAKSKGTNVSLPCGGLNKPKLPHTVISQWPDTAVSPCRKLWLIGLPDWHSIYNYLEVSPLEITGTSFHVGMHRLGLLDDLLTPSTFMSLLKHHQAMKVHFTEFSF